MAEVYRKDNNTLLCFISGSCYWGFENGTENRIEKESIKVFNDELKPGDKIIGFDSGKDRSSYLLNRGYLIYMGKIASTLFFENYDPENPAPQGDLFNEAPKWYLSFLTLDEYTGLFMFSQPCACWDVQPKKIIRYNESA